MRCTARALLCIFVFAWCASSAQAFSLPHDAGAHAERPREWWRTLAHLQAADGRRFEAAATFFRFAVVPPSDVRGAWSTTAILSVSVAIGDESQRTTFTAHTLERDALGLAHAAKSRLDLAVGHSFLRALDAASNSERRFRVHVETGGASAELEQRVVQPAVPLGSQAYAYPRLDVRGTLRIGAESVAVRGTGWLDHEYGADQLDRGEIGWDRFVMHFDDGRVVMIEQRRLRGNRKSLASTGIFVDRRGRATRLSARDFRIVNALDTHWQSPHTGARYPSLWEIFVPLAGLDLAVIPPFLDQEISAEGAGASYYCGAITLERAPLPEHTDTGRGFVELTGYARPLVF